MYIRLKTKIQTLYCYAKTPDCIYIRVVANDCLFSEQAQN
jgi:hypothetical protein